MSTEAIAAITMVVLPIVLGLLVWLLLLHR